MTSLHPAIQTGRTAFISGGASGIGLAVAHKMADAGMSLLLADLNAEALAAAAAGFSGTQVETCVLDVSDFSAFEAVTEKLAGGLPPLGVIFNNAGASINPGHTWEQPDTWRKQLEVNLWGVMNGVQALLPQMVAGDAPGLVINTGSKQGLTKPPGNYAYNVSKAGVVAFTECLAHDLRGAVGDRISAHLLIPGFTYSGMISQFIDEKPDGAWTCEQVADFLMDALAAGDFYVLCPDNDVPRPIDEKRLQWAADDLIQNRPALSRWHPDFAEAFEDFMKG